MSKMDKMVEDLVLEGLQEQGIGGDHKTVLEVAAAMLRLASRMVLRVGLERGKTPIEAHEAFLATCSSMMKVAMVDEFVRRLAGDAPSCDGDCANCKEPHAHASDSTPIPPPEGVN